MTAAARDRQYRTDVGDEFVDEITGIRYVVERVWRAEDIRNGDPVCGGAGATEKNSLWGGRSEETRRDGI
jgi:hypothetical protein